MKNKWQISLIIVMALYANTIIIAPTLAIDSTIQITRSPFLSFVQIPSSFSIAPAMSVPVSDTAVLSDSGASLPSSRYLTIQDTRNSGGLSLQVEASSFLPAPVSPNPLLNNNFRMITSTADAITGTNVQTINGIKYYGENRDAFAGPTNIVTPLNSSASDFSNPAIFTDSTFFTNPAYFTGYGNILEPGIPLDLMQGCLNSGGRNGFMHLSTSFHLIIPKFIAPNDYYTTLTYTLMDNTGTCP
jgi:hypothetical protein